MTDVSITFTQDELKQLKGATNAWLMDVVRLERAYTIKLIGTITTCASAHKKVLEACDEKE